MMIKLSFSNLFRRKTRTLLSVAGIAIGVTAIIVLVSLVDGFTVQFDQVVSQFKGVMVIQKDSGNHLLSHLDESFGPKLEAIHGVKVAIPELFILPQKINGEPVGVDVAGTIVLYGVDTGKYLASGSRGWLSEIDSGSEIGPSDTGWVVIGKKVQKNYHKSVGSTIKINDKAFKVKGILATESDELGGVIAMNISDARDLVQNSDKQVNEFLVILSDPTKDSEIADLIKLKYPHDLDTVTQADLSQQIGSILGNLRLLAIAIAMISSIVAGIGIANTILMSVLERFREIGALKAVGWTQGNIIKMVLYEAGMMGVIGGILGIATGFAIDNAIQYYAGIQYSISPSLLVWCFGFALFLGVLSGIYPAYHASRLDPIEALTS